MVIKSLGVLCGGDWAPTISTYADGKRKVTFAVALSRDGNSKKNFDIFMMKAFDKVADKFLSEVMMDEKHMKEECQGMTISIQYCMENNTDRPLCNEVEFIATFINTKPGVSITIDGLPDFAKSKTKVNIEKAPETQNCDNVVSTAKTDKPSIRDEQVSVETIDKKPDPTPNEESQELIVPIGCLESIRSLKDVVPEKIPSTLAEDQSYQDFRRMMA